jgi:hypothetical protein
MKRLLVAASMLAALVITIGVFTAQARTDARKTDRATIQFTEPVKLLNVILKGQYLFVHDEEKMASGQDCTFVYDSSGKLVVSFHCVPVERAKAKGFRVVSSRVGTSNGPMEMKEFQFEGSTEAHQVP